jgi:hypothetical protein
VSWSIGGSLHEELHLPAQSLEERFQRSVCLPGSIEIHGPDQLGRELDATERVGG